MPEITIREIIQCAHPIDAEVALRLAKYFGTSAELWMGIQMQYGLELAHDKYGEQIAQNVIISDHAKAMNIS